MKKKKGGARLPCKHRGSANQLKAHSAGGRARGRAGQWHVWGRSSVFSRHSRGSAKLICILLLFQRRQNVLKHKVMTESPTEGYCLHTECKKKEEEWRKWPLESSTSWKPLLCNDVKPGRVYKGEERTREGKTSPDKEPESSCFVGFMQFWDINFDHVLPFSTDIWYSNPWWRTSIFLQVAKSFIDPSQEASYGEECCALLSPC